MEDFFDYNGVQECQKQLDVKFSEFASMLKDANDYMNDNIDVSHDSAIFGELGKKFLAEWNENASTFSDFYENFRAWSELMGSIMASYGTFEMDTVKNAMAANESSGAGLRGVQETRAALRFNQDEADKQVMYEQQKVERINPTQLEQLGWEKSLVRNGTDSSAVDDKVKATEQAIMNGDTIYDTDGNAVNGLKLCPERMDEEYTNEYLIYQGMDAQGNVNYYSIDLDGKMKKVNTVEVPKVKDTFKVGDEYQITADLNGDNNKERISKASYIVGYHKDSNQTYMALPRSDGSVEYYTVEGNINGWASDTGNNWCGKVTNINVTATDVKNAGLQPLYEDQTFSSQDVAAIKEENKFNNINQ